MIQINCTNCKSLLQIDDAFAGGVCRCRHCGTIQTVPKRLKATSVAGSESPDANGNGQNTPSKSLYQNQKRGAVETVGSGTGLDDLAGIVASSGLSSSRLQKKSPPPAVAKPAGAAWDRKVVAIAASAGGLIVLLLGVIISMAVRDRTGDAAPDPQTTQPPLVASRNDGGPSPAAPKGPAFLGQPVTQQSVVFVLDRGGYSRTDNRFQLLRSALLLALKSLTPEQRFQVVFWNVPREQPQAWPASGTAVATPENVAQCKEKLVEMVAEGGATEETAALATALKSQPQAIVLVPIKPFPTEQDAFANRVIAQCATANFKGSVYCFSLGQPDWGSGLNRLAKSLRGDYRDVPLDELRRLIGE